MPLFTIPVRLFDCIITSYDLPDPERGKPYPDMLQILLGRLNVLAQNAIMVGDAEGDVRMAQTAEVELFWSLRGSFLVPRLVHSVITASLIPSSICLQYCGLKTEATVIHRTAKICILLARNVYYKRYVDLSAHCVSLGAMSRYIHRPRTGHKKAE